MNGTVIIQLIAIIVPSVGIATGIIIGVLKHLITRNAQLADKRFETIDKRFEAIDKRFETMDKRIDGLEHKVDNLTKEVYKIIGHIFGKDKQGK